MHTRGSMYRGSILIHGSSGYDFVVLNRTYAYVDLRANGEDAIKSVNQKI